MKIFAAIMALIVLALSVMPCGDKASAFNHGKIKLELTASSHHNNPQTDNCSPFCQCNCCAGFSIKHSFPSITNISHSYSSKPKATYLLSPASEVALPIWQPPQLV